MYPFLIFIDFELNLYSLVISFFYDNIYSVIPNSISTNEMKLDRKNHVLSFTILTLKISILLNFVSPSLTE